MRACEQWPPLPLCRSAWLVHCCLDSCYGGVCRGGRGVGGGVALAATAAAESAATETAAATSYGPLPPALLAVALAASLWIGRRLLPTLLLPVWRTSNDATAAAAAEDRCLLPGVVIPLFPSSTACCFHLVVRVRERGRLGWDIPLQCDRGCLFQTPAKLCNSFKTLRSCHYRFSTEKQHKRYLGKLLVLKKKINVRSVLPSPGEVMLLLAMHIDKCAATDINKC